MTQLNNIADALELRRKIAGDFRIGIYEPSNRGAVYSAVIMDMEKIKYKRQKGER